MELYCSHELIHLLHIMFSVVHGYAEHANLCLQRDAFKLQVC